MQGRRLEIKRRVSRMKRTVAAGVLAAACVAAALGAGVASAANVTAAQIVAENVAARGGLDAWRKIQTMVWLGHIESDHAPLPSMAFVLEQKRPNMTHYVIHAMHESSQRAFDGRQGWRVGPNRGGGPDAQPYTMQELRFAQAAPGLDGPLIDSAAKGNVVTLEGLDEIEGRKAYRLAVRLASGETDRLWIDARTLLEMRYDRPSDGVVGAARPVTVMYRDYKTFNGLLIPSVIETVSGAGHTPDRMVIERVVLNSPLDDSRFAKPGTPSRRNSRTAGATTDARAPMPASTAVGDVSRDAGSAPK